MISLIDNNFDSNSLDGCLMDFFKMLGLGILGLVCLIGFIAYIFS